MIKNSSLNDFIDNGNNNPRIAEYDELILKIKNKDQEIKEITQKLQDLNANYIPDDAPTIDDILSNPELCKHIDDSAIDQLQKNIKSAEALNHKNAELFTASITNIKNSVVQIQQKLDEQKRLFNDDAGRLQTRIVKITNLMSSPEYVHSEKMVGLGQLRNSCELLKAKLEKINANITETDTKSACFSSFLTWLDKQSIGEPVNLSADLRKQLEDNKYIVTTDIDHLQMLHQQYNVSGSYIKELNEKQNLENTKDVKTVPQKIEYWKLQFAALQSKYKLEFDNGRIGLAEKAGTAYTTDVTNCIEGITKQLTNNDNGDLTKAAKSLNEAMWYLVLQPYFNLAKFGLLNKKELDYDGLRLSINNELLNPNVHTLVLCKWIDKIVEHSSLLSIKVNNIITGCQVQLPTDKAQPLFTNGIAKIQAFDSKYIAENEEAHRKNYNLTIRDYLHNLIYIKSDKLDDVNNTKNKANQSSYKIDKKFFTGLHIFSLTVQRLDRDEKFIKKDKSLDMAAAEAFYENVRTLCNTIHHTDGVGLQTNTAFNQYGSNENASGLNRVANKIIVAKNTVMAKGSTGETSTGHLYQMLIDARFKFKSDVPIRKIA